MGRPKLQYESCQIGSNIEKSHFSTSFALNTPTERLILQLDYIDRRVVARS